MASSQGDILATITARRAVDVAEAKARTPVEALHARIEARYPALPVDLYALLTEYLDDFTVAAEFKRASPSKGAFVDEGVDVADHAAAYIAGGARVLSVLTEPHWFKGSLSDLEAARGVAERVAKSTGGPRVAVLRKEFVLDAYQVVEARAHGADTVLLIVSMLPSVSVLQPMIASCRALGMEPLVEVNSVEEMGVALSAGSLAVGINNRNLRTFTVDLGTTSRVTAYAAERYAAEVATNPSARPVAILSLSGLKNGEDVRSLAHEVGAACGGGLPLHPSSSLPLGLHIMRGFLVGEALMRAPAPADMVAELVSAGAEAMRDVQAGGRTGGRAAPSLEPAVKVCGLRTPDAAVHAAKCGADFCGIIMVPGTPRGVSVEVARGITSALKGYREQDPGALLAQAHAAPPSSSSLDDAAADTGRLQAAGVLLRAAALRARPLSVGVFMDQRPADVAADAVAAGCDVVQLHGAEEVGPFAASAGFPLPVIKVVHITVGGDPAALAAEVQVAAARIAAWSRVACAVLLDSRVSGGGASGGSGAAFDHAAVLPALATALAARSEQCSAAALPFMLAGGLQPETVGAAVGAARAAEASSSTPSTLRLALWAADVSSGVELSPSALLPDGSTAGRGVKDPVRVEAFVRAARGALVAGREGGGGA